MSAARGSRRLTTAWRLLAALASSRRAGEVAPLLDGSNDAGFTRRLRVRFSEGLWDLFRSGWLRLRR